MFRQLFSKPYHLLGLFGLIIFLFSFFSNNSGTLDLHIHDTVFIISIPHILKALAAALLFFWLIYNFTIKILFSKAITWIHIIGTLLFSFYMAALNYNIQNTSETERNGWTTFEQIDDANFIISILILFFLVCQLLFIFNIIVGLIKSKIK
jgi:heme/copper-type cytochrome/quinol oxidase subunit 1